MEQNLCVLIDFENIAAGCEKEGLGRFNINGVLNRLKDKGRILECRAYGDWGRFARFKQSLLEAGVHMMELTSYRGQDKNRADIAMVVDAMELAFTRDFIDTFVVLSGDSDFTPLVTRLRAMNKRVIGIGTRGSTSRLIIGAVDEFIFYESIRHGAVKKKAVAAPSEDDKVVSLSKDEAFEMLGEVLDGLQKDDAQPVLAGLVKQSLQRKAPAFNETDYGYAGFARFLEAAREKGLVSLSKAERAGGYQVDQPRADGEPEPVEEDDLPELEGAAANMRDELTARGFNPVTHMMRHTVMHEFVDHVQERAARDRKNSLKYTVGDTARRCRKTDPPVATRHVRSVINALAQAGQLLHADGTPVRSASAPFLVQKDAEELLTALLCFYLQTLKDNGQAMDDIEAFSRLFYGDTEHVEEITALIAGLAQNATPADPAEPAHSEAASIADTADTEDAEDTTSLSN